MIIVQDILEELGVTRAYKGYSHTEYALELVLEDEDRLEAVTKKVYQETARHFHCHWTAVERNIRTVIQRVWRVNPTLLQKMARYPLTEAPTTRDFLSIITAYIQRTALVK